MVGCASSNATTSKGSLMRKYTVILASILIAVGVAAAGTAAGEQNKSKSKPAGAPTTQGNAKSCKVIRDGNCEEAEFRDQSRKGVVKK